MASPFAPLTPKQINTQVDQRVQAAFGPQEQLIKSQADQRRATAEAAAKALADLQAAIGPGIEGAFRSGADQIAGLGAGYAGAARQALEGDAATLQTGLQANARGALPPETLQAILSEAAPTKTADTIYGLGGSLPAQGMIREGLAFGAQGRLLPGQTLARGQEEVFQAGADESKALLELAAKRPEYREQVIDALYKLELDKLNARIAQSELGIKTRAQKLYERQFGETVRSNKADESIRRQSLANQIANHELAVAKAQAQGLEVNASASKSLGYLVDQYGNPIKDKHGKRIPIKDSPTAKDSQKQYQAAVAEAKQMLGEPIEADASSYKMPPPGKYIARPGAKGVFPPRKDATGHQLYPPTTNNPRLAQRDSSMTFAEAVNYLMQHYGLSKAQANKALRAGGWRPVGDRPKAGKAASSSPR